MGIEKQVKVVLMLKRVIAISLAGLFVVGVPTVSQASAPSEAVRYGDSDALIGNELDFGLDLESNPITDDGVVEVTLPFPINFFGNWYSIACIDINGTLHFRDDTGECAGSEYDDSLEDLADAYDSPIISALALDLILAEDSSVHAGAFEDHNWFVITWSNMRTFETRQSLDLDEDDLFGRDPDLAYVDGEHLTFQLVIKKGSTGSQMDGFDFDLEWNYETINDLGDGYYCGNDQQSFQESYLIWSGESYESEVLGVHRDISLASNDFCWPVGWSNYNSVDDVGVDIFDMFDGKNRRQMIDGGSYALTSNRLNSDVDGRYILTMSGGETVGFPASNNSPAAPAATTTPKLATTGANVEWLMIAGLLAAIAGVSFLTVSRRKRTA